MVNDIKITIIAGLWKETGLGQDVHVVLQVGTLRIEVPGVVTDFDYNSKFQSTTFTLTPDGISDAEVAVMKENGDSNE